MYRNIVFDMGNVLLRFEPDVFLEAVGVPEADRLLLKRNVYQSLDWARMDRGSMDEAAAAASMCCRLPERLHPYVHALVDQWDRPILPVEGMEALVKELKEKGYGVYLLSNASFRQPEYWNRVPGSQYFDGTMVSAFVKRVKPEHEIYELFYVRFGLDPRECLFIDDSIANIEGAEHAGMDGIVFHGDVQELRGVLKEKGIL